MPPIQCQSEKESRASTHEMEKRAALFGSTYNKLGMIQGLVWPLGKDGVHIHETPIPPPEADCQSSAVRSCFWLT